jgi:hypothetical protein
MPPVVATERTSRFASSGRYNERFFLFQGVPSSVETVPSHRNGVKVFAFQSARGVNTIVSWVPFHEKAPSVEGEREKDERTDLVPWLPKTRKRRAHGDLPPGLPTRENGIR